MFSSQNKLRAFIGLCVKRSSGVPVIGFCVVKVIE